MSKEQKCSATQINRIVIHKGNVEKRIYKNELAKYLDDGWLKGASEEHKRRNSAAKKGKSSWNKGKSPNAQYRANISNTLKQKYQNGEISVWNKGLTLDDERVKHYSDKCKITKIKKYGSASPMFNKPMSDEHKAKIAKSNKGKTRKLSPDKLIIKTTKQYLTRKKNNTFNVSSNEIKLYEDLLKMYDSKTICKQYKDDKRYPFYCDFYVVEDDLFIELNAHWTHGGRPYDPNDTFCQEQLARWQEKAKTSQFYVNAINTWTVRDVEKLHYAQKYNLNYKVIY